MKSKKSIWYLGYLISVIIILIILITNLSSQVDAGLGILFAAVFSVSHVQILHTKMLSTDSNYRTEVLDERHISIKEKSGNISNMVNMLLMSLATIIFLIMDYTIPAIILGIIVFIQPFILIVISNSIEKKM